VYFIQIKKILLRVKFKSLLNCNQNLNSRGFFEFLKRKMESLPQSCLLNMETLPLTLQKNNPSQN
jgi:hypothetical protein